MKETKPKELKTTAIVRKEPDGLVPDAQNMSIIADRLLKSGMWPQFKNEAEVFAAAEYGRELGLGPVMSLNSIFPVNGKLGMMTNVMLAVASQRAGVTWKIEAMTPKGCTIVFSRPGFEPLKASFDEADAKAAGLISKDNWKAYPTDMYFIRAAARGIRKIAPDAVLGLYSVEELRDIGPDVAGIMPKADEIKEAEIVKEKEPEPLKKITEKPKEEPKSESPKEQTELDVMKTEIASFLKQLEKHGFPQADMKKKIQERILNVDKRAVADIPNDLTEREAKYIRNALAVTVKEKEELTKKEAKDGAL